MKRTKMKGKSLDAKAITKTVISRRGIESIELSLEVKCSGEDFETNVRKSAKLLTDSNLEKVKSFSLKVEILD